MPDPLNSVEKKDPLSAVEKLDSSHRVEAFRSGQHSLDLFLKKYALKNQQADSSQTYVVSRAKRAVGYYSLTAGSVEQKHCPPNVVEGMPEAYPIPVVLLARLAVDVCEQDRGLGRALLKDAFLRIAAAADIVGARAVLVHAIDEKARAFYEHFEFEEFPSGTLHMMLTLTSVRAAIAGA